MRIAATCLVSLCLTSVTCYGQTLDPLTGHSLFQKPPGVVTRWSSFENLAAAPGAGGAENRGAKGHAFDSVAAGETKLLLDLKGSGTIRRMWLTLRPRDPAILRALRLEMTWDGADKPAVSVPLGDFFNWVHGQPAAFENALFANPEARSFVCFVPMPFRTAARITITNESQIHIPDPVYFDQECRVTIQQIGGTNKKEVMKMVDDDISIKPISADADGQFIKLLEKERPLELLRNVSDSSWVNYYRQDDVSAVAFFYLDSPTSTLPALADVASRVADMKPAVETE